MSLPEKIKSFVDSAPISLVAQEGGPLSVQEIRNFYETEVAAKVSDEKYGELLYAGLLMAQDYIWEAHEIVQDFSEQEASWWHAFMHRMEGDYGNAAYWYRRVGDCKHFASLLSAAQSLSFETSAADILAWDSWDSFKLNDMISSADGAYREELHAVHRLECLLLLKICFVKATA